MIDMQKRRRLTPQSRRQEILAAAIKLLREKGIATRVEDITSAAGAAKGTFFTCYASWDDLLEAVRAHHIASFNASNALTLPDTVMGWHKLLPQLSVRFIDFILGMGGTHEVLFHSAFTLARPLPPAERPASRIAAILRSGQAAGAYASFDADTIGRLIFAMIHDTADAIVAGEDRVTALDTLNLAMHRMTQPETRP
jgi:AcrR family transcriptional regulator